MELLSVCRSCLAGDRLLEPPGRYSALLDLLAPHVLESDAVPLEARVCWECRALLRRVHLFTERAHSAGLLLYAYWTEQAGEPVKTLTRQCQSALGLTEIASHTYLACHETELIHMPDSKPNLLKAEFPDVRDELKDVEIKTEPQFDIDDDEPLINHRSDEKCRKVKKKKKSKTETRKTKAAKKEFDLAEEKSEDVNCLLSDDHNEEATVDDGIYEEIAQVVTEEESSNVRKERKPVKRKVAVKRTKGVKQEKVQKVKRKKKREVAVVPESERYSAVLVSEEELAAWRAADGKLERYTTMRLPHKCTTCLLPFRWQEQLAQHNLKKHHPALGDWECDVCATRFARAADAAAHRRLHLTRYECLHCEHVTRDKRDIDKHYELEHCEAKYKCTVCGEAFKTFFQQRYHREAAHRPLWQCQHCDKSFRLRGGLYSHMRIHQELPKAECPVCGKVYKNKYALMYHLRVHEVSASPHYCRPCDVHFKSKNQLRLHMTSSMKHVSPDKLKFACEACGRRFITDKRREHHYDSVHLNKTEFACTECSKAYANKQSLRSHVLRKHKLTTPPRDKICDICGKGFHNNVLLRNHMRTHTGERPFHCKLCPSTFGYSAALYTHNRLVHLKMKREKTYKKKPAPAADFPDKGQWEGETYSY